MMSFLELSFESEDDSLSVRRFSVREAISALFEIDVVARSPNDDLDLEAFVGRPAVLRIEHGLKHAVHGRRHFRGVCSYMEQVQAESTGLSTYHLRIVPALWLLTQRRNHRIFQHLSAPEIVGKLLAEWGIEPVWKVQKVPYPKLEYRVQYGESDFDFLSRILEEAGIAYAFPDEGGKPSALTFLDAPHTADAREGGPLPYVDNPNQAAARELVTKVRVAQEVRPGKVTFRDFDFRRRPEYKLLGEATTASSTEARLEHYRYAPGAFVVEGHKGGETPVADHNSIARADESAGKARAERALARERASRRKVAFHTNAIDLRPGVVFSMANHPRADLGADKRLLVTDLSIEGAHDGEWTTAGHAVFTAQPYHPPKTTPKPQIHSVQSAVVVGPKGQEIYTDEFGRVRVQFHWDREGEFDEGSSCWMRVTQGWAGGGFGMLAIPRVGQEVVVGFFEGDPDQPVVVGRVFNNATRVPYKLPEHKTRSTWKSDSSPGSDGFNEIMFEDAKGHERVYVQAERNLDKLVKHDETITVGKNRATTVGKVDEAAIGEREAVHIKGSETGREMVAGRISLTTGEATITLEGPNITLQAAANILLSAGASILANAGANVTINGAASVMVNGSADVTIASGGTATVRAGGGDLVLQGGPMINMNPGAGGGAADDARPSTLAFGDVRVIVPPDVDVRANVALAAKHRHDNPRYFTNMVDEGGSWDYAGRGPQFETFHIFHLGMMGRAMGLPRGALMRYVRSHHMPTDVGLDYIGPFTVAGCAYFDNDPKWSPAGRPTSTESPCDATMADKQMTSTERVKIYRLCNLDSWDFYEIAPSEGASPMFSIATRVLSEFRQMEYEVWESCANQPRLTGSMPYQDTQRQWSEVAHVELIRRVICEAYSELRIG
ncbi:type VI secretion system tip protein TssI/VgrG [Sorangium sp. So ce291]|uniref:type VI secretion system Vgr family protein n=1 Tax=Sorangium sp. So ce291 TaxID=3133294 RepID=UPI003F620D97